MALASAIMDIARAKLNDIPGDLFTNDVLLPHLKSAWNILQSSMKSNGIPTTRTTSAALSIPAGATSISSSSVPPYPANLVEPIELWEKAPSGGEKDYVEMKEASWAPFEQQRPILGVWAWESQEIKLVGATQIRDVKIRYVANLAEITGASTNIPVISSEEYLGTKAAALAAEFIGANRTRADRLESMAEIERRKFINIAVKGMQGIKKTRIPYGTKRRRVGWLPLPQ
jgi:hypothetical protein